MTINNNLVTRADVTINGKTCDISKYLIEGQKRFVIEITPFLRDGNDNTLSIQGITPDTSYLEVYIPYPYLAEGKPEDVGFNSTKLNLVDTMIKEEIAKGFPGAAYIIIKNGKVVKRAAHGYSRKYKDDGTLLDKFEDMTLDTLFDMASNTKMFATNFALMKLFSEKKFHYLDPLTKHIAEYKGSDKNGERREDRLISDLITHVAGYAPDPHFFNPQEIPPEEYTLDKEKTKKILLEIHGFERKRGGVPEYSDVDYMILGLLVERLTKMELDEYVESHIYKPLGLKNTLFNPLKKQYNKKQFAATEVIGNTYNKTVYYPQIRTNVIQGEVDDPKCFYCMGGNGGPAGLFSNINEMAVLCQVLLNRGGYNNVKLWDRNTQDLFVKPYDEDLTFGLGWRRQGNEGLQWHFSRYGSSKAVGHTGWTGTVTIIDPQYDLAIVLLTSKKHSLYYNSKFEGDAYQTGQYGSITQLIYEAFLNK